MAAKPPYRELERRLQESEQRWNNFLNQNVAGIWRWEYRQPMPLSLPIDEQIEWMLDQAELIECNDVAAEMYGVSSPEGSHLQALSEPGVNLSAHRAPIVPVDGTKPARQCGNKNL